MYLKYVFIIISNVIVDIYNAFTLPSVAIKMNYDFSEKTVGTRAQRANVYICERQKVNFPT